MATTTQHVPKLATETQYSCFKSCSAQIHIMLSNHASDRARTQVADEFSSLQRRNQARQ